jgi:hypothetical protein
LHKRTKIPASRILESGAAPPALATDDKAYQSSVTLTNPIKQAPDWAQRRWPSSGRAHLMSKWTSKAPHSARETPPRYYLNPPVQSPRVLRSPECREGIRCPGADHGGTNLTLSYWSLAPQQLVQNQTRSRGLLSLSRQCPGCFLQVQLGERNSTGCTQPSDVRGPRALDNHQRYTYHAGSHSLQNILATRWHLVLDVTRRRGLLMIIVALSPCHTPNHS